MRSLIVLSNIEEEWNSFLSTPEPDVPIEVFQVTPEDLDSQKKLFQSLLSHCKDCSFLTVNCHAGTTYFKKFDRRLKVIREKSINTFTECSNPKNAGFQIHIQGDRWGLPVCPFISGLWWGREYLVTHSSDYENDRKVWYPGTSPGPSKNRRVLVIPDYQRTHLSKPILNGWTWKNLLLESFFTSQHISGMTFLSSMLSLRQSNQKEWTVLQFFSIPHRTRFPVHWE